MKKLSYLLPLAAIVAISSCCGKGNNSGKIEQTIDIDTITDTTGNAIKVQRIASDIGDFTVFHLRRRQIIFAVDEIPTRLNPVLCVAAAFSKRDTTSYRFDSREIANDFVIKGKPRHGYFCPIARTGAFVSYGNNQWIVNNSCDPFYFNCNHSYMDSAIKNEGYYFMQNLIIWDTNDDPRFVRSAYEDTDVSNVWRCLA